MSSKRQNTELSLRNSEQGPPQHPLSLPPPPLRHRPTDREKVELLLYPYVDLLLSFIYTEQWELSLFTAVSFVRPVQIIGMVLRSAPSHV